MKKLKISALAGLALLSVISARGQPIFTSTTHTIPVLITIPISNGIKCGSGFYLTQSNNVYFITAAHVLFQIISNRISDILINSNAQLICETEEPSGKLGLQANLVRLQQKGLIKRHNYRDIAVIEVGIDISGNTCFDDSITFQAIPTNSRFTRYDVQSDCRLFDDVAVGNDTYTLGYPISLLNTQDPEIDFSTSLVRKGIVSQKNMVTRKLIIDSAVYSGNSGGPVLIVERPQPQTTVFKFIGIITQYVPAKAAVTLTPATTNGVSVDVNSGYSVAEPIDFALELLNQFPPH